MQGGGVVSQIDEFLNARTCKVFQLSLVLFVINFETLHQYTCFFSFTYKKLIKYDNCV